MDIGVLVFREGLECILVLSAITASMVKSEESYRRPVAAGAGVAFLATLVTWFIAVGIVYDLTKSINALYIQAATGLLAIFVLLVVMNWFFHKVYWTGWISLHNKRKHALIKGAADENTSRQRLLYGMALLGFTSFYREGVEVVLFLQSYRLKLGGEPVFDGLRKSVVRQPKPSASNTGLTATWVTPVDTRMFGRTNLIRRSRQLYSKLVQQIRSSNLGDMSCTA